MAKGAGEQGAEARPDLHLTRHKGQDFAQYDGVVVGKTKAYIAEHNLTAPNPDAPLPAAGP
jgi:hypothetical protein